MQIYSRTKTKIKILVLVGFWVVGLNFFDSVLSYSQSPDDRGKLLTVGSMLVVYLF